MLDSCQFVARPVFSTDNHKMERFLHPGRFSLASVYGPISFPSLPLVVLKISEGSDAPAVAALGILRESQNPEDVRWFKPVEVLYKCGRRGRVREPVGTYGAMKCIFNGVGAAT